MPKEFLEARESAIGKLDSDELAALVGPFAALATLADSEAKLQAFNALANSTTDGSSNGPKYLGPRGEEWTAGEWLTYVSEKLKGIGQDEFGRRYDQMRDAAAAAR